MTNKTIKVWDPLVRIFHWSLVASFVIAYLSGDENESIHVIAGYTILGLITFRVLWGFVGSKYARFSNFLSSPKEALNYLKGLLNKNPKDYVGHNPAGGWMVVALLMTLSFTVFSGLKVYAIEEGKGLLAENYIQLSIISNAYADDDDHHSDDHYEDHDGEEFWEEIHELASNFMLFLIFLHIAGVIISGKAHNINLVKAMITGKKAVKTEPKH